MELTDAELHNLVKVDDHWVDRDVLGIAEKINEYDPNLRVQYLEIAASVGEPPFRVVEKGLDGVDRVVLSAWQLDNTVYDRVVMHDNFRVNVLDELEKQNAKAKAEEQRLGKEARQEDTRIAHAILSTNKTSYSIPDERTGEILTFREDGTVKRESRRNASKGSASVR